MDGPKPDYRLKNFTIGNGELTLMAGPCSLESLELGLEVARVMKRLCEERGVGCIFKASFDKANRTSIHSWRGPGIVRGLEELAQIKKELDVPVVTDIHEPWQAAQAAEVADVLQIPAFLCRQTDLLTAAASTGKILNIKKAQFLAPEDMKNVVEKCREAGNDRVLLCERGTMMGYRQLVVDMRSLVTMRALGCPVVFDATHSVQKPGAMGGVSGGDREMALPLARAAAAVGIDVLFVETHPDPASAKSDGPNMIPLSEMGAFLDQVLAIHRVRQALRQQEGGTVCGGAETALGA
ncbi:MAG: 3-deoxy-8-phosphooctulonate synthase [Synergistaceae bacterium]|jgi:2-dehydro-3-deoxyphosphooctonate aldolase (KDO 8-P synthase)|nr:3-deoxy-8-phosphooctulonate synthase [Synergistaceae bacterium]